MGCRIEGYFNVLLVPGNFHIGFHSKGGLVQRIIQQRMGAFDVNFKHKINHLYFAAPKNNGVMKDLIRDFNLKNTATLTGYSSTSMNSENGPFSYNYKLLIVPTDLVYEDDHKYDVFQYRSFWNVPTITNNFNFLINVDYDLSSLTMVETRKKKHLNEFVIHICGIIGGLVSFMSFIHVLIQKSVIKLIQKHAMGKLE